MIRYMIVVLLVVLASAGLVLADEIVPATPRTFQAKNVEAEAFSRINEEGQRLLDLEKQLTTAREQLAARYQAALADVRERLQREHVAGVTSSTEIKLKLGEGNRLVFEIAPVGTK